MIEMGSSDRFINEIITYRFKSADINQFRSEALIINIDSNAEKRRLQSIADNG